MKHLIDVLVIKHEVLYILNVNLSLSMEIKTDIIIKTYREN